MKKQNERLSDENCSCEGRQGKMTNIEKFLLLLCMSVLIVSCIWDILTLNEIGYELADEYVMLLVSSAMCYLTVTDKI